MMPRIVQRNFYVVTYTLNLALIPTFLACGVTGILLFPGFLDWCGISMRRFPMDTVVWLHDWSGVALDVGVTLHLLLHLKPTWQFVRTKVLRRPARHRPRAKDLEALATGVASETA